jgi:hypothetical protein
VRNFHVSSNSALPTCEAEALRDHIPELTGTSNIVDNDDQGTCE